MIWWTLRQLRSKDPETRKRAAEKLGEVKDPRAVESLVAALEDSDWYVRREATNALIEIGNAAVIPLIAALKDSVSYARLRAAEALGRIGDTRAVGPLVVAFNDYDEYMTEEAAAALVKIGHASVEPLVSALKDGVGIVRPKAANALGKIGDARAVEPLVSALKDVSSVMRLEAANALGKIGDARAAEPLVSALKDWNTEVREAVMKALELLEWQPVDKEQCALWAVVHKQWNEAASMAEIALEPLVIMLSDKEDSVREAAAGALGKIRDARAVKPLAALLKREYCQTAVWALGEIGDVRAVEPLAAMLKGDTWRKAAVVEALEKIGGRQAIEALVTVIGDGYIGKAAAEALIRNGKASVEPLASALKNDPVEAAGVLGKIGYDAVEPLIEALKHGGSVGRRIVAGVLGKIGDVRVVEPLIAALNDSDSDVRVTVAVVLGEIGDARAIKPLMAALKDSHSYVQEKAAEALGKLKDIDDDVQNAATEVLERIHYERAFQRFIYDLENNNADVRAKAASALGELGDPRAIKPLSKMLKNNLYHDVWENAAEALGKIGDERAIEPLIAALNFYNYETVCMKAAEALEKIGDVAIGPLLVALKDGEREVRLGIPSILGQIGDMRAVEPLVAALKDDSGDSRNNRSVCKEAAKALVKIGDVAVGPLITALKDAGSNVRARAASVLGQIGDARAVDPLVAMLTDSNWSVRQKAAAALSLLNWQPTDEAQRVNFAIASHSWIITVQLGAIAVEPLIAAIEDLRLEDNIKEAIWALGAIKDARAVGPLVKLAHDDWVATTAVNALRQLLESSAQNSNEADIQAAAALMYVPQIEYHKDECGYSYKTTKQIDCSHVRQLARQELIRRGLEA